MEHVTYSSFIHSPLEKALGDLIRKIVAEELKKAQSTTHYTIHTSEGVTPEQVHKQVAAALRATEEKQAPTSRNRLEIKNGQLSVTPPVDEVTRLID